MIHHMNLDPECVMSMANHLHNLFHFLTTGNYFEAAESPDGSLMGYMLGKVEGEGTLWHGHVSAVTVAPAYRRLGLAKTLMDDLESKCIHMYNAYFVDLFVRASNELAIAMYQKLDYVTYRRRDRRRWRGCVGYEKSLAQG